MGRSSSILSIYTVIGFLSWRAESSQSSMSRVSLGFLHDKFLFSGSKTISIGCGLWGYTGDLNQHGIANGHGVAVSQQDPNFKLEGTFRDDQLHGLGELSLHL